jgi:predicted nucleic acid-binding protein
MRLVIDTNRIIASRLKDGMSRKLLLNPGFEFYCPEHTLSEIMQHESEICRKARITQPQLSILLSIIFENIVVLAEDEYRRFLKPSNSMISDVDDIPFIAASIAVKAEGIWTDDNQFRQQKKIRIYPTKDLPLM